MKLNYTLKIVALFLCLLPGILRAQEIPGTPNELDNQFVPDKNSIFNSESKTGTNNSTPASDIINIIKFNATMLPRGIVSFFYQRILTEQISIQSGLGASFNKDRILSFVSGVSEEFSNNPSTVGLNKIMQFGEFNGASLFASLSMRLSWESYYGDFTPYFEINSRYYSNKLRLTKLNEYNSFELLDGTPEVIIRNTSFNLIYGVQYLTEGQIRTSHEYYLGVGMRNTSFNAFTSSEVQMSNNNYTLYTKTAARSKTFAPSFIIGYVFGIGF